MSLYKWKVRIDRLPKMPNAILWKHWRVIKRERDLWEEEIMAAFAGHKPPAPLHNADVTYERCSAGPEPDYENLCFSFKHVQDALVSQGILIDDKPSVIGVTYGWRQVPRGKGRITIAIREWL